MNWLILKAVFQGVHPTGFTTKELYEGNGSPIKCEYKDDTMTIEICRMTCAHQCISELLPQCDRRVERAVCDSCEGKTGKCYLPKGIQGCYDNLWRQHIISWDCVKISPGRP